MINKFIGQGNISFKTDKKGKKYCYLEIRYLEENDKEHRKYIRGNDVRVACAKGDKFINDTLIEISQRDTNIALNKTFDEFCTTYLHSIYKHTVKESTYITALRTFKNYVSPHIGYLKMRNIDSLVVANLINALVEKEYSLILETTGYAGGGAPQKALASSIERSELVTKNNKLAQVRKDV